MIDPQKSPDFITPPSAITSTEKTVSHEGSSKTLTEAAKDGRVAVRPKEIGLAVMVKLNKQFGDNAVVDTLVECMAATKTIAVGGRPMEVPDYKIRLDSAKTVMQYQVGNAVTRTEVVTHNVDTLSSLQSKLQKSPALRRAVGNMLTGSGGGGVNGEGIVDVSPQRELSNEEASEATAELQRLPQSEDTEVGKAIRKVVPVEDLRSKGSMKDAAQKFSN